MSGKYGSIGQQLTRAGVSGSAHRPGCPCCDISGRLSLVRGIRWGASTPAGEAPGNQTVARAGNPALRSDGERSSPGRARRVPRRIQPPFETRESPNRQDAPLPRPTSTPLLPVRKSKEREKPHLSPASPGARPRLLHQHRISAGARGPCPGPVMPVRVKSHDDRRPVRSLAAVFVIQPYRYTKFRGDRLGGCSVREDFAVCSEQPCGGRRSAAAAAGATGA